MDAHPSRIRHCAPPPPLPLTVGAGASLGGSLVHVGLISHGQPVPFEHILCRFGLAPPAKPLQYTSDWALCRAPPSYVARASSTEHVINFSEDGPITFYPAARLATIGDAAIVEGVLRLTDPSRPSTALSPYEQLSTRATALGSAVLTLRRPYNALFWFEIAFELLMEGSGPYDGFGLSVCIGDLGDDAQPTTPFGETGAGGGLCVLFRSDHDQPEPFNRQTVEVWYAGERLQRLPAGARLRTSSWVAVHIRHDDDGLHIAHDGHQYLTAYQIRRWSPDATWRLGFGARSATSSATRTAADVRYSPTTAPLGAASRHWVRTLHLTSGLLVADATVPVSLSSNGQQFAPSPLEFTYYAMPSVSAVTPTSGPIAGGTRVVASGSKLDAGVEHTDSARLGYRCRFGSAMRIELPRNACLPYLPTLSHADADCYYGDQVCARERARVCTRPLARCMARRHPAAAGADAR